MSSFTTTEYIALGSSISFLLVFGGAFQALSLLAMVQPAFRDFELTPYFLNIVISNIVVIIVDFPAVAGAAWSEKNLLSPVYCQIVGFLTGVGSITTVFTITLCIIKTHRKVNSAEILNNADRSSLQHNTIKTLTASWMYAIVTMTPPLFGWGSFATESGGAVCAPNWRDTSVAGRAYLVTLAILAYGFPLSICTVLLIKTYRKIQQFPVFSAETRELPTKWKEIFNVVFVAVAAFAVSWTPYCICAMINVFGGSEMLDREKSFIPGIFAKASSVYNPIVPLLFSKRFRKEVANMARLFFHRASVDNNLEVPHNSHSANFNQPDAPPQWLENLEEVRDTSHHTYRHSESSV